MEDGGNEDTGAEDSDTETAVPDNEIEPTIADDGLDAANDKPTVADGKNEDTAVEESDNETVVPDNEIELTTDDDDDLGAADDTLTLESTPSPRPTTGALCLPVVGNAITQPQVPPSYIFAAERGRAYDRDWMTKYNISMRAIGRAIRGDVSKYKRTDLVSNKVIKAGVDLQVKCKERDLQRIME